MYCMICGIYITQRHTLCQMCKAKIKMDDNDNMVSKRDMDEMKMIERHSNYYDKYIGYLKGNV